LRPIDILTEEIAIEVTGVLSPGKCCEKVTVPFLDYVHVLKP